jgi:hypothetical protein
MNEVIAWVGFLGAWQAVERTRWPGWLFWPLVVVMLGLSVLNTAARMTRDETGQRAVKTEG